MRKKTPLEWYNAELAKRPQDVGLWYAKGVLQVKEGEHKEAIKCFEKVTELDPDHRKGWYAEAEAHFRLGNYEDSIYALDRLIDISEDDEIFWYKKGEALLKLGRYAEANTCYDKAIELRPDYADAWCGKGNALKGIGKEETRGEEKGEDGDHTKSEAFKDALESFKKVLDLSPRHHEAMGSRGTLLCDMGDCDRGFADIDRAVRGNPNLYEPLYRKGKALESQGRKQSAADAYRKIIEHSLTGEHRGSVDSYYWKGRAATEIGHPELALENFNRILVLNPKHVDTLIAKGDTLSSMGRPEEALIVFDKAISLAPNQGHIWFLKANTQRDLGRLDDALVSYGKATSARPQMKDAWYNRGLVHYAEENLREGLRDFLEVLQLDSSHIGARKMKSIIETQLSTQVDGVLQLSLQTLKEKGIAPSTVSGRGAPIVGTVSGGLTKEELVYNGVRFFSEERYRDALHCFDRAIEIDNQDYTLCEWKADTLAKLARYSEAIEWYDKAVKLKHRKGEDIDEKVDGSKSGRVEAAHVTEWKPIDEIQRVQGSTSMDIGVALQSGTRLHDSDVEDNTEFSIDDAQMAILDALVGKPRTLPEISRLCDSGLTDLFPVIERLISLGYLERLRTVITLEKGTRRICLYRTVEEKYRGQNE